MYRWASTRSVIGVLALFSTLTTTKLSAQSEKVPDITTVATSGAVTESRYANAYFKLTIDAPNATLQLNPVMNTAGQYARLVQILAKTTNWVDVYTFAVSAETLSNLDKYPNTPPSRYVRSVRHQLEREGLTTVQEEFPVSIAGVEFTGAILEVPESNGRKHYRGVYTTFRQGYILSLDAEASSQKRLTELVQRMVAFSK